MAYTSWSVVANEQPSAAKWNLLGSNDASFNDGTGIGTGAIGTTALAAAAVTAAKMQYGMVRQRQGGLTGDASWQSPGSSNTDTSAKGIFIQCGVVTCAAGNATVTFPTAYTQLPIVVATANTATSQNAWAKIQNISTTAFQIGLVINNTTAATSENAAWIAIGQ